MCGGGNEREQLIYSFSEVDRALIVKAALTEWLHDRKECNQISQTIQCASLFLCLSRKGANSTISVALSIYGSLDSGLAIKMVGKLSVLRLLAWTCKSQNFVKLNCYWQIGKSGLYH